MTKPSQSASKISVSLFPNDYARINDIMAFMLKAGVRVNVSTAIRLALRSAPVDGKMLKVLKQIEADDGRRQ